MNGSRAQIGHSTREPARLASRTDAAHAKRIVIKIGSSSLTSPSGDLNRAAIRELSSTVSGLVASGRDVVIVSSGAIAAALGPMGLSERPREVSVQQAAASIGQGLLLAAYTEEFGSHGVRVGQVLLTENDVIRSDTYRNVRGLLEELVRLGVVPIVNENDATATHEIRFGDNDRLASLVAQVMGADLLVLLTDVDGLFTKPPSEPRAERIGVVHDAARLDGVSIGTVGSSVGTGGMVTKLSAAHSAAITGTATILTVPQRLSEVLTGNDVGTFFPAGSGRRRSRLMWLRYATRGEGTLVLDSGAVDAVTRRRMSVLPVGITAVHGDFHEGVPVDLVSENGQLVARGLTHVGSEMLRKMAGLSSEDIRESMGEEFARAVVHRDDLVVVNR